MGDQGDPNPMWIHKRVSCVAYNTWIQKIQSLTPLDIYTYYTIPIYIYTLVQILDVCNIILALADVLKRSIILQRARVIYHLRS